MTTNFEPQMSSPVREGRAAERTPYARPTVSRTELVAAASAKRVMDKRLNRPSDDWVLKLTQQR